MVLPWGVSLITAFFVPEQWNAVWPTEFLESAAKEWRWNLSGALFVQWLHNFTYHFPQAHTLTTCFQACHLNTWGDSQLLSGRMPLIRQQRMTPLQCEATVIYIALTPLSACMPPVQVPVSRVSHRVYMFMHWAITQSVDLTTVQTILKPLKS